MKNSWKERLLAMAAHFIISLVVFLIPSIFITYWLYPGVFFWGDGGLEGMKIALLVDLVLGPGLTFIVFNRLKKSLRFDLAVVGLIQIAAFIFGVYNVVTVRPFALVYGGQFVHSIPGFVLTDQKANTNTFERPQLKMVKVPVDIKERAAYVKDVVNNESRPFQYIPRLWHEWDINAIKQDKLCIKPGSFELLKTESSQKLAKELWDANASKNPDCILIGQFRYYNALIVFKGSDILDYIRADVGPIIVY